MLNILNCKVVDWKKPSCLRINALCITSSLLLINVTGCMTQPVQATYVSSAKYKDYTCAQLRSEYMRLKQLANTNRSSTFDTSGVNVGVVGGNWGISPRVSIDLGRHNVNNRNEVARLLGEKNAIESAGRFKGCEFIVPVTQTQTTPKETMPTEK